MSIYLEEPLEPSCDCEDKCMCPNPFDDEQYLEHMRKMFRDGEEE